MIVKIKFQCSTWIFFSYSSASHIFEWCCCSTPILSNFPLKLLGQIEPKLVMKILGWCILKTVLCLSWFSSLKDKNMYPSSKKRIWPRLYIFIAFEWVTLWIFVTINKTAFKMRQIYHSVGKPPCDIFFHMSALTRVLYENIPWVNVDRFHFDLSKMDWNKHGKLFLCKYIYYLFAQKFIETIQLLKLPPLK